MAKFSLRDFDDDRLQPESWCDRSHWSCDDERQADGIDPCGILVQERSEIVR